MIALWLAACSALPFLPSVGEAGPDVRGECAAEDAPSTCNPEGPPARDPQSVLAEPLAICSTQPLTGWFRDGTCRTDTADRGLHTVCAELTDGFLDYTKARGNDLSTPRGGFPGLKSGDRWCLCAARWEEARRAGVAPPVVLEATDDAALRVIDREVL
ncbi:MAG: DUF2237 domain-containing protein, partial [Myxococcota bacterium]